MPGKTNTDASLIKLLSESTAIKNIIFSKLTDDDKLALRAVDTTSNQLIKNYVEGPYQTKKSFAVAATGLYRDKKYFTKACQLYDTTIQSKSFKPAALYKMKDWDTLLKNREIYEFADGDNLGETGRVYCPGDFHIWPVNQSWLAAQFHKGRSFELLSEVNGDVKLSEQPVKYSSFAKEIAAVIKAGYEITDIRSYHVTLSPVVDKDKNVTWRSIAEVTPKIEDTEKTIPIIKAAYQSHFDALKSADKIAGLFTSDLNSLSEGTLQDKVASCLIGPVNNKIYVQTLLRTLHKKYPCQFPDKIPNSSPQFFASDLLSWVRELIKSKLEEQVAKLKDQLEVKNLVSLSA
jgi:hypothetical protein